DLVDGYHAVAIEIAGAIVAARRRAALRAAVERRVHRAHDFVDGHAAVEVQITRTVGALRPTDFCVACDQHDDQQQRPPPPPHAFHDAVCPGSPKRGSVRNLSSVRLCKKAMRSTFSAGVMMKPTRNLSFNGLSLPTPALGPLSIVRP